MTPTPSPRLAGRIVTLGVTGSIAAYKAILATRLLLREGARVRVVMTRSAERFVGAATFAGLTGEPVHGELFTEGDVGEKHVALARESDLILVLPATADIVSRLASGRADDLLTATVLSATCPVLLAPAMHPTMWSHPATTRNVQSLVESGRVEFLGPVHGVVASGDIGEGRMVEPELAVEAVLSRLSGGPLLGRHVVVTAGPTVEDIDPVRFVSNRSSGKMGFAVAEEARRRGARVTLVAGPVSLPTPGGVTRVDVRSARDLAQALDDLFGEGLGGADVLVMCAAVGDYRPARVAKSKLKRESEGDLELQLVPNPDILAGLGKRRRGKSPLLVGFAVETGTQSEMVRRARKKLVAKGVDVVIANHAGDSLGKDDNRILIVDERRVEALEVLPKAVVARRIVGWVEERLASRPGEKQRRRRTPRRRGARRA
jgi:phosphopantothenoylcysteine decarboxylase/phosphopantothenate--cysteine ligase